MEEILKLQKLESIEVEELDKGPKLSWTAVFGLSTISRYC
ncbi:class III lanthipeptide [Staphylococcus hominis]|nr:class III lanthipeptide [Staphylococcus hominis]